MRNPSRRELTRSGDWNDRVEGGGSGEADLAWRLLGRRAQVFLHYNITPRLSWSGNPREFVVPRHRLGSGVNTILVGLCEIE